MKYIKSKKKRLYSSIILIGMIIFVCNGLLVSSEEISWLPVYQIEAVGGWKADAPDIAINGQYIYIVWQSWISEYACVISFTQSADAGKTWAETQWFTANDSIADSPKISCDENFVHVVWKEVRGNFTEIYYKRSKNYGTTWELDRQLTFNNTIMTNIYDVKIAAKDNRVYVVWKDYRTGSSEVFLKKSMDNGDTWSEDIRVTNDFSPSYHPEIAIGSESVWIVWDDWGDNAEICYSKSDDFGDTWNKKHFLTDDGKSKEADIAINDDNISIVWQDDRTDNYEIYYIESTDNGETWCNIEQLTNTPGMSVIPNIAINNDLVSIVWMDDSTGHYEIYYQQRQGLLNWTTAQQVTNTSYEAIYPSVALLNSYPFIVWKTYCSAHQSNISFTHSLLNQPIVLNIVAQEVVMHQSSRIHLDIYGIDHTYDSSELQCIVQLQDPLGSWEDLQNPIFVDDHWEQEIEFTNESSLGIYHVRAMITNPERTQSLWSDPTSIVVTQSEISNESPDFEFLLLIGSIMVCLFLKKSYEKRRGNQ